jgi:hypothetical protein
MQGICLLLQCFIPSASPLSTAPLLLLLLLCTGLLLSCIQDPDPCIFLEPKILYVALALHVHAAW